MTIRAIIDRRLRKTMMAMFGGFAVFIIGMIVHIWTKASGLPIISLVGIGLSFVTIFYALLGIRCPHCKTILGYIAMYKGVFIPDSIFSMSKKIKFCPFCGVSFDTEIEISHEV